MKVHCVCKDCNNSKPRLSAALLLYTELRAAASREEVVGISTRSDAHTRQPALPVSQIRQIVRNAAKRESTCRVREFTRFRRLAKISAIDVGARVNNSRSGINAQSFCIGRQSKSNSSASIYSFSLSLSL